MKKISYICIVKTKTNKNMKKEVKKTQSKSEKIYAQYKKQESFLTDYQICKAFFHDPSCSVLCLVEKILKEKYNLPWQLKFIRKATMAARGKSNAVITIPQFKFEETTHAILSKYIRRNFDTILADQQSNREYPFMFRDIIEKYS